MCLGTFSFYSDYLRILRSIDFGFGFASELEKLRFVSESGLDEGCPATSAGSQDYISTLDLDNL